ncbi:MAG: hypothetical protein ABIS67_02990 [Candidatus Eisenbacteria bacterium]
MHSFRAGTPAFPPARAARRSVFPSWGSVAAPVLLLAGVAGCTALQEIAALRTVAFDFDRVSNVRLAGVPIGSGTRFSTLSLSDAARLAAAVAVKQVPIELVAHVSAANPAANKVSARMLALDWTFFVEDRQTLAGALDAPVVIAPGTTSDVPLAVRFDLLQLGSGGARDMFDLAVAVAGYGGVKKDLRLELLPTIDTSLGPMRYPAPVVVRRSAP